MAFRLSSYSRLFRVSRAHRLAAIIAASLVSLCHIAHAETIKSALARAYAGNPDLNQQRANVLARDEDVSKAEGGRRPKLNASLNGGPQFNRLREPAGRNSSNQRVYSTEHVIGEPRAAGVGVTQTLFDGWRTDNSIQQAEAGVFAARETMRLTEQSTLQNGATAYMNVLRDTAVVSLRKSNIAVLEEQLRVTRDRAALGDTTMTDVAQAQAALAHAQTESVLCSNRHHGLTAVANSPKVFSLCAF